ncbi:Hypothetical predicted protein [Paramuricea clavata]|uniref:Uncharacterized protein n=1 Tax=Paramuricea clavata TaxID=317549 RepID=A0A6S7G2C5_PARCT|nr:Hypothetical predicted protein [Paramuricea clavata]
MADLKLFGKNKEQIHSLVKTVHIVSKDIGMEFGIKKCGMLVMKRGKIVECNGIQLPDEETIKFVEEDGYKYLGILELDKIMEGEMKRKFVKEYRRRLRLVLKSKLNGRNKIMAMNTWAVALLRYGAGVLKWTKDEIAAMDRKTRKLMTLYGALHPRSDSHRLYLPREKGGRGLISCEECIRTKENSLGWYVKNSVEPLLQQIAKTGVIETERCEIKENFKKKATESLDLQENLCGLYQLEKAEKWYEHQPNGVIKSDNVKILRDFNIQCDHVIECRRPDIVVVLKKEKECNIIDIAVPGDCRIGGIEKGNLENMGNKESRSHSNSSRCLRSS